MSKVTWERRHEAFKAIHDAITEESFSVFDVDMNYGEALKLIRYKGELYILISPWGQIWRFDTRNWNKVYDVAEKHGRNPINPSDVYSKWAFTSWDACHFSVDDKLYFVGSYFPQSAAAVLRYSKSTETWEFLNLLSTVGSGEFLSVREFAGYLYAGRDNGEIWRSVDGSTWTKVFNAVAGYNYIHALGVGGSPERIWAGLSQQENGNMSSDKHGKICVSLNGVDWTQDFDLPDSGGVSALGPGSGIGRDYCLAGSNYGHIYLWDGSFQAWRKIGKVGLPVLNIRQRLVTHPIPDWLLTCGARFGAAGGGGGAIYRVMNGRLLQIFRSYSHAIFSHESFNAELYYSWGWADVVSTTTIRGHYAGVKRIRETLLDLLIRQKPTPMFDAASAATTDSPAVLLYFNLGNWPNRVLRMRNIGANDFQYRIEGSDDSVSFITLGDYDGPAPGYAPVEIDFSTSPYAVIRILVSSTMPGQPTTVDATIQCW